MSANRDLGDLLMREDILSKVLVHLVDSGLHECRRVCRRWYEVCNKLPVKLSLSLDEDRCFDPDQFPNAVSLKFDAGISLDYAFMETSLLPSLSKLNGITYLEFSIAEWPPVRFQPNCSAAFHSVRSLSLKIHHKSVFLEFLETLTRLTELRALKLDMVAAVSDVIDVAPITKIKKLRELSARLCFLISRENQFIFGTQTQLTKLEVLKDILPSFFTGVIMQAIYPHTPSLRSLMLNGPTMYRSLPIIDYDSLRHLSQLDQLALRRIITKSEDFFSVLWSLSKLTALKIVHVSIPKIASVLDCIFSMSKLKALTFIPTGPQTARHICPAPRMSQMQLTKLSWHFDVSLLQMVHLADITHFEVLIAEQDCLEDIVCALKSMVDLQYLSIRSWRRELPAPSDLLVGMTSLRQLEVIGQVAADPAIYETLATFPRLTDLCLEFLPEIPDSISLHSQINLLTNLRSLRIHFTDSLRQGGFLDSLSGENLKRLQKLNVPSENLDSDGRAALFRRLPSLRYFSAEYMEYLFD